MWRIVEWISSPPVNHGPAGQATELLLRVDIAIVACLLNCACDIVYFGVANRLARVLEEMANRRLSLTWRW